MQTKDLTDAVKNTIVSEVYDQLYDQYLENHKKQEEMHWKKYYEILEKDPVCYTLLSLSKTHTSSTMTSTLMDFVENYATQLTIQEMGEYQQHIDYPTIERELNLFSTTVDFEECEDAYEVVDVLVEYFLEKLNTEKS